MSEHRDLLSTADADATFERYLVATADFDDTPLRRRPLALLGLALCAVLAVPVVLIEIPLFVGLAVIAVVMRACLPARVVLVDVQGQHIADRGRD